jgi:uncharacterized C2H2 Zn-finger protein
MRCSNCLRTFSGGSHYTSHLASCDGDNRQCPHCRTWFPTRTARDRHVDEHHSRLHEKGT